MTTREKIVQALDGLSPTELEQVARYLTLVKTHCGLSESSEVDETHLAALYAEFADEDRELAEQGLPDFATALSEAEV